MSVKRATVQIHSSPFYANISVPKARLLLSNSRFDVWDKNAD